jgi:hypothetical protein
MLYDSLGIRVAAHVVATTVSADTGIDDSRTTFAYDSRGRTLVERYDRGADGMDDNVDTYVFNALGQQVSGVFEYDDDANGTLEQRDANEKTYGPLGAPRQLAKMLKVVGKPFSGFATETLFSTLPMANGPYAVRVRLVPSEANGKPSASAKADWGADFAARLRRGPLHWDMQLQFYASEKLTPIEDASVNWPTPYVTVARLMLPQQDTQAAEGRQLAERIEATVIDPWQAMADHRPLGDVQRARKVVYFQSQKGRGAT